MSARGFTNSRRKGREKRSEAYTRLEGAACISSAAHASMYLGGISVTAGQKRVSVQWWAVIVVIVTPPMPQHPPRKPVSAPLTPWQGSGCVSPEERTEVVIVVMEGVSEGRVCRRVIDMRDAPALDCHQDS